MSENIESVKRFWESAPLWTGESDHESGSKQFFEEHRAVVVEDCFAGEIDPRIFPQGESKKRVLDLGCGPGMWTVTLAQSGCEEVIAADLTENALKLARKRCEIYGLSNVTFQQENAESLSLEDESVTHVNCQGVIHHTPNTEKCVQEIARVLKPGGTACLSVYYKNALLKAWPAINFVGKPLTRLGGGLKGRGREKIFDSKDVNEIVRLYDGAENPIGKAYSKKEFIQMCAPYFEIEDDYLHFFPSRALPVKLPSAVRKVLDSRLGFMIFLSLRKR